MTMDENGPTTCPLCGAAARYEFSGRDLMFGHHRRHDYHRCDACGAVFQQPMPDPETITSFYPAEYGVYDEQERTRRLGAWRRALLRRLRGYRHLAVPLPLRLLAALLAPWIRPPATPPFVPGGRLLDVGCGNGRYLSTMRSLGWQVQGVEFSAEGVRVCRRAGLPVHLGDLASAAFPDASFDVVTVRHVIEHIPEPHAFLAELARVLKPGGRLHVETPNSEALGRAWFGPAWYHNDVPRHLILYSPRNLTRLAECHGLRLLETLMDTSPKAFLNSLDYIMENRDRPSRRSRGRRLLARFYTMQARRRGREDTFHLVLTRP